MTFTRVSHIFFLSLLASQCLWSQNSRVERKGGGELPEFHRLPGLPEVSSRIRVEQSSSKPFKVLHYALDAQLAMVNSEFHGTMTIRCQITAPTDLLFFHSVGLVFDSVHVNGSPASYAFFPSQERFRVALPRTFAIGETVTVAITYERDLSFPRFEERRGYYWYPKDFQPGHVWQNIGYTMSEPSDARLWMPCYDDPSEKATADINVTVPAGYIGASNGRLTSIESNPDGTVTYRWSSEYPIATYLMVITASSYATYSHFYGKVTAPTDSIEVQYYMWREDSAGAQFNAVQAFSKTVRMMEAYSHIFGEYPFEKYGMAVVYPFLYGGMEHQTLSSIHRAWISVAAYPHYEDGIAHELAHQWWGNMVTCRTWADIWLNEGFASYAEALWREVEYGEASYEQKMRSFRTFNVTWRGAMYDPLSQGYPLFNSSVYHKGAWVLHMLRAVVGDSLFFAILGNYRQVHEYGAATTRDFQDVVNATAGASYDWFFDQWVYGGGWPEYAYTTHWDPNTQSYTVKVFQMQDSLWQTFKMPLELKVWKNGVATPFVVVDSLRFQSFTFQLGAQPDSLQFDPRNRILKRIVAPPPGETDRDELPNAFRLYQNYPNPFNPLTIIQYDLPMRTRVRLEVADLLGRSIGTLVDEIQEPGSYQKEFLARRLASGVYFYRLVTPQSILTRKMTIVR